jgi:hypothetical protein
MVGSSSNRRLVQSLLFSSVLPTAYREELERIVFFNPEQDRVTECLLDSVHRYGVPLIVEEQGSLRFRVPAFGPVQTLYALDQTVRPASLAGVVMYVRESRDTMLVLHLAVHEDYVAGSLYGEDWVTPRLLATVRTTCQRIRGITCMRLLYPHEIQVRLDRLSA